MVIAYHLILSCYGFWLPNDPRGSWSDFVRRYELYAFGPATKVNTRQSLAARDHDAEQRRAAKSALKYKPVRFTGKQARSVAQGFAFRATRSNYAVHACAVMPDHAHLVIARHPQRIETISNQLKGAATRQLVKDRLHPFVGVRDAKGQTPSPWAHGQWKVFIDSETQLDNAIRYVAQNPTKAGLKPQHWKFVKPPNL
jgi:REP element-mobilizing transposase RayT